ncbi:hypothetical protein DL768_010550 [Monosporascus sp. mg162]|nr:hypothetical protein DL768_010550 [Monosporascus sp. mg162]
MRTADEVLASDGDLIVEVIEQGHQTPDAAGDQHVRASATCHVSKSRTAQYMNLSKTDASHFYDNVVIQGETIKAARLWLQTFHRTPELDSRALQEFDITDVFPVTKFGQIYLKSRKQGAELSNGENQLRTAKDLSCYESGFKRAYWFDCAVIFRDVTRGLAYGAVRYLGDLTPCGVAGMDIQGVPGPVLTPAAKGMPPRQRKPSSARSEKG